MAVGVAPHSVRACPADWAQLNATLAGARIFAQTTLVGFAKLGGFIGVYTYDAMWTSALRADPDLVTITSYNEWSEGTQIEPAKPEPAAGAYLSYDGAWGRHGRAASRAYLWRTACWTSVLAGRLSRC